MNSNAIERVIEEALDDGYIKEDSVKLLRMIQFSVNEEDAYIVITKLLADKDYTHNLREIKKIGYNNTNEQRLCDALGFSGAFKVFYKNGTTELYAWKYGSYDLTFIQFPDPQEKPHQKVVDNILKILKDAQPDGADPFFSYEVRAKWIDVALDGDCILIIYQSQEADPSYIKEEIIELLKERLPEFGKIEIWLDASDRSGNKATYQVI